MQLFSRFGRLLRADAHGLLEALEDRRLLLAQHLREAELELERKRARLGALEEEERARGDDARRLEESLRALDADARLALEEQRDGLARFTVRRLLALRKESAALRERIEEIRGERERLGARLAEQERDFTELRARVKTRLAERAASEPDLAPASVSEEEIEMELLRRRRSAGGPS